ncbi:MAG: cyclic nucleotide-binding domain-containing protein [bacterium]
MSDRRARRSDPVARDPAPREPVAPAREAPPTRDLRVDPAGLSASGMDSAGFDLGVSADTDVDAALDHHQGRSLHEDYAAYRREQLSRPVEARFHAGHIRLSSLFAALPRPVLDRLIAGAEHRTVRIGVPIVRAGDRFEGPFVLTRGRIAREKETDGRRRALLGPVEPGDLFGLVELVRGGRWRTTARAELECDILRLPVRAVDEARGDHPRWEQALRDVAARRLADELLAGSGLFGHMEPGLRSTLGQKFEMRVFGSGEMLIAAGERVDGLYLVIAGEVDVEQDDAYLTTLGSGDLVGIVAALEKSPTRVRAVAATPVEAFHLGEEALRVALAVPEVHAAFTAAVERRRSVLEGGQY